MKMYNEPISKGDEYEDSINPNYCSSSPWSVIFTPAENLLVSNAAGLLELSRNLTPGASSGGVTRAGPSFFTIILVTVIIGLALVALICIAVQCFFR